MNEITKEDIEWWEQFLSKQIGSKSSRYYFFEHLLKLAKTVQELQEIKK